MKRQPLSNTMEFVFNQDKSVLSFDGPETTKVPKFSGLEQPLAQAHASFAGADYSYEAWIFDDRSVSNARLTGKVRFLVLDNSSGALVKEFLLWIPKASIVTVDIPSSQQSNGKQIKVILTADRPIEVLGRPPWCSVRCIVSGP